LSPEAFWFDIDWERLGAHGKLVVPFLAERYGLALEAGQLPLRLDAAEGSFSVWHYEHRFPVCPLQYPIILDRALAALGDAEPAAAAEVTAIAEQFRVLAEQEGEESRAALPAECGGLKARLAAAIAASPPLAEALAQALHLINGSPDQPDSYGTLHRILEAQTYRLAHWRVAASDINYRRFFDINSLAGLRMEEPALFRHAHALVFGLVGEGRVQGLRVDHIDGLADPAGYCRALQAAVGPGFYVVVEKILERGEELRPWPIAGTTGYDALNLVDGVLVDDDGARRLAAQYRAVTGSEQRYPALLRGTKAEVLEASFASELEVLVSDLKRLADADRRTRDYTATALRRALAEIIARLPVYRTYIDEAGPGEDDRRLVEETVRRAKRGTVLPDTSVHDFIALALIGEADDEETDRPLAVLVAHFRRRFQQLTGPVLAKSLEDTLFYRDVPLLALNEVGGDPGHAGVPVAAFHAANVARAADWPHAMLASSTHDTKRGEDARARLLALSELPDAWQAAWQEFEQAVAPLLGEGEDGPVPDADDRWMIAQGLLGAWPLELMADAPVDSDALAAFAERFSGFLTKALREAKRHTSWVNLNESYEAAAAVLTAGVLQVGSPALDALRPLARRLAFAGALNGLAAAVLKCTIPGVPDIYQGAELWDFSLVDPDNRRPVDFAARAAALRGRRGWKAQLKAWPDGTLKQRVLARLLAARTDAPALFAEGDYRALGTAGARAAHVLGFIRRRHDERLAVAVPRLLAPHLEPGAWSLGTFWRDTRLDLPAGRWQDVLTGVVVEAGGSGVPVPELFATLPVAVLRNLA
jgi:(1->4)-alpha-D-glucan 1-alpha-D-glucosylmutase